MIIEGNIWFDILICDPICKVNSPSLLLLRHMETRTREFRRDTMDFKWIMNFFQRLSRTSNLNSVALSNSKQPKMITFSYRFLQISPKIRALQINLRAVDLTIRVLCNKADSVPRRESIRELYNYLCVWALKTAQCCGIMTAKNYTLH